MNLTALFTPSLVCQQSDSISSIRKLFELISRLAATSIPECNTMDIVHTLTQRERLGSTYIGHGVAIPHAKLADLTQPIAILIHLSSAINYDSSISEGADLIFALLIPEDETDLHLQILAELVEHLHNATFRERLRATTSSAALYQTLIQLLKEGSDARD